MVFLSVIKNKKNFLLSVKHLINILKRSIFNMTNYNSYNYKAFIIPMFMFLNTQDLIP